MKKILTISEPNCGGKPTGYAVEIPNENRETLAAEIRRGLEKGWYFNEVMAESAILDEDLDALKAKGYTYIPSDGVDEKLCGAAKGRFLVEVTIMDVSEGGDSNWRKMHPVGLSSIYAVIHEEGGFPYFLTENSKFSANVSNAMLMWRREAYAAREAGNLILKERGHPLAGKLKVVSLWYREKPDEEE